MIGYIILVKGFINLGFLHFFFIIEWKEAYRQSIKKNAERITNEGV